MRFSKINNNDIVNGLGVLMSIWTQGCPHRCKGCFNPETWKFGEGKVFSEEDLKDILENINRNNVERNFSVLGGEPLCPENVEGVLYLCKELKAHYPNKIIYLWTGYVWEEFDELQKKVMKYIDILVDGKFEEENKHLGLMLRGSANQRIIDVKSTIEKGEVKLKSEFYEAN